MQTQTESERTTKDHDLQKKHRPFLSKWKDGRPWLKTTSDNETVTSMHCAVCRRHPLKPSGPGKPNNAFIKGSTNFRLEAVIRHEGSWVHQKATEMCEDEGFVYALEDSVDVIHRLNDDNVDDFLETKPDVNDVNPIKSTQAHVKSNKRKYKIVQASKMVALFRNVHAITLNGQPFSDYIWLCQLDEMKGIELERKYLGEKHAVSFLHYIAESEREKIKMAVEDSRFVSVICDCMPGETSNHSEEIIYLRTVSRGEVNTHMINYVVLDDYPEPEEVYMQAITNGLQKILGLNEEDWIWKLVGFGSNRSQGSISTGGVLELIKDVFKRNAPWLQGLHCEPYSLELEIKKNLLNVGMYQKLHDLLLQVHNFYQQNPLNRVGLKVVSFANSNHHKSFSTVPPDPEYHNVTKLVDHDESECSRPQQNTLNAVNHKSCISYMKTAISNLAEMYPDMVQHFEEMQKEDFGSSITEAAKALQLLKDLQEKHMVLFLHLVWDLMDVLESLFQSLRDPHNTVFNSYIAIEGTMTTIRRWYTCDGEHLSSVSDLLHGEYNYRGIKLTTNSNNFLASKDLLLCIVCDVLKGHFSDLSSDIRNAIIIGDVKHWPQSLPNNMGFGEDCVSTLINHFKAVLERIGINVHKAAVEWTSMKMDLYNSTPQLYSRNWQDIFASVGNKYSNILALIDLILALPSYTPLREEGIKLVKSMKSDWRKTLNHNIKADIMTMALHSGSILSFLPMRSVELWANKERIILERENVSHNQDLSKSVSVSLSESLQDKDEPKITKEEPSINKLDNSMDFDCDTDNDGLDVDLDMFSCDKCDKKFDKRSDLIKHGVIHSRKRYGGSRPCHCPLCNKTFKNKASLSAHISVQHRRKGQSVPHLTFVKRKKAQVKMKVVRNVCLLCDYVFSSVKRLRQHKMVYHGISPYKCKICQKCFRSKTVLTEHQRVHTGERPYKCFICDKLFRRKADAREHSSVHDENRPKYPCSTCGKTFKQKIHLKYHEMTHSNNYRYYCDQCGKGFQINCLLVRHKIRTHSDVRPFKCSKCPKWFKTSRDLKMHAASHDPDKRYPCKICGKAFQTKHLVEGHIMRIHEKDKLPLQCNKCGKRFRHPTMLEAHLRVHTGETPFQCDTCGRTFKQKGHLTAHTRTHTGERPYSCQLCDTRFTVSCSLRKHMRYVHEGIKRKNTTLQKKNSLQRIEKSITADTPMRNVSMHQTLTNLPPIVLAPPQHSQQIDSFMVEPMDNMNLHGQYQTSHEPNVLDQNTLKIAPITVHGGLMPPPVAIHSGGMQPESIPQGPVTTGSLQPANVPTANHMSGYWFMGSNYQGTN